MKYYNFFKFKPILVLFVIFVCLSIIHILFATLIERGLVIDGGLFMPHILDNLSNKGYGFELGLWRPRVTINFINQVPLNIAYYLGVHSRTDLCRCLSLSFFLFPFLVTMYNLYLAKRTKRYDIALLGLVLYGVFILPGIMYAIVEMYLASALIVLFYHYFIADIVYTKKDIFIICLISIILLCASEIIVLISPLFLISLILYLLKKPKFSKEKIVKIYIGISTILASITELLYIYCFIPINQYNNDGVSFFKEIIDPRPHLFFDLLKEPYIVQYILIISVLFLLFYKKKLKTKQILILSFIFISVFLYMLFNAAQYFYKFYYVSYRVILPIVFPLLFYFVFMQNILKKYFSKQKLCNLFIVVLLTCIINTLIEIVYSNNVYKFEKIFYNIINNSSNTFFTPEADLHDVYYDPNNIFFNVNNASIDMLLLTDDYKLEKIVLPALKPFDQMFRKLEYNIDKNEFRAYFYTMSIKNKFWDLTSIAEKFNNDNNLIETYKF